MATPAPARASSSAVARPMPRLPPVTNARFPVRSITALPVRNGASAPLAAVRSIPHSAFRIPHWPSSRQALFNHFANQMFDGEMNLLNARGIVRRHHQRQIGEILELAAAAAQERHDRDAAR